MFRQAQTLFERRQSLLSERFESNTQLNQVRTTTYCSFPDQAFSIVDRTSFAVMLRLGVHRVASFDKDFAIFRFGARRDRSFEIVR